MAEGDNKTSESDEDEVLVKDQQGIDGYGGGAQSIEQPFEDRTIETHCVWSSPAPVVLLAIVAS